MCTVFALFLLPGCEMFGGKGAHQGNGEGVPVEHSHLDVTLVNHCAHAVEVCYGSVHVCVSLADQRSRLVRAEANGNQVFVSIKGSSTSVYADETFDQIEIDPSCERLERRIGTERESTAATAGGPAR